ncbi:S41 family peptidase [candidate division KSB1 bacterium]|nr:S41 family peptidase [candidate division KSB1 bacterium]
MNRKRLGYAAILLSTLVLALVLISGGFLAAGQNIYRQLNKLTRVIKIIHSVYVEVPDGGKLIDGAVRGMLEQLDPHSVYIPPKKLAKVEEKFKGSFTGIGISFMVQNKILTVISPIPGTPSDRLGIRSGDQIVEIDGVSAIGITTQGVYEKLRGPKGTEVKIKVRRSGVKDLLDFTIQRDEIPIYSVEAGFLLDDSTGYVLLNRFSSTTADELEKTLSELEAGGMRRLILDLRGNSGGYLEQAVRVADIFIEGDRKIVYTRGRLPDSNQDYYATYRATHPKIPLIILINHGSASASEIVAGAVQDWDRGLIVGTTTFGKGLVQRQYVLEDSSAIRVTVARYYTPSGRLIQRSYEEGISQYYRDGYDEKDPNFQADSAADRPIYYTHAGRTVYGGGGITPDVFLKSKYLTLTTSKILGKRLFFEYAFQYVADHKDLTHSFAGFLGDFKVNKRMIRGFKVFIKEKGIEVIEKDFEQDIEYIKVFIKGEIAQSLWSNREKYYQVRIQGDPQVQEALKLFGQAREIAGIF